MSAPYFMTRAKPHHASAASKPLDEKNSFTKIMYLSDSESEEELVIIFKKEPKVKFDESKNKVYYISQETYFAIKSLKPVPSSSSKEESSSLHF